MARFLYSFFIAVWVLMAGCQNTDTGDLHIDETEVMVFIDSGLRPEVLLFPDYLLPEDYELDQHGRIPGTSLVGAGMKVGKGIRQVEAQFGNLLSQKEWTVSARESSDQSFRLMADHSSGSYVEIRGVQGTGPTHIFILFRPEATTRKEIQ
jgi:hypothetical protein